MSSAAPVDPLLEQQLAGLSIEERAMVRWQLRQAAAARASVHRFFEYVIREETTQQRVPELPHQKLFFDFRDRHRQCVIRMPVGFGKTINSGTYLLHAAGHDPLLTAAIISSTADQAEKPLAMVRFYIEESPELRLVFPSLKPTQRKGEPWGQHKLVIDRAGIMRDPTFIAIGQDSGRLPGSRLKLIAVDDVLSYENSRTEAQRRDVANWFGGEVLSRRLKVKGEEARICVTNTPRDPKDLTYMLEQRGWPTVTMDCFGDIKFSNTDFDAPDIRPTCRISDLERRTLEQLSDEDRTKKELEMPCRLAANDRADLVLQAERDNDSAALPPVDPTFDHNEVVPLWPERWSLAALLKDREEAISLREWNQTMRCQAASNDTARVKDEWIERAKQLAKDLGYERMLTEWKRGNAYTGVDLAVGRGKQHDSTCLFTIHIDEAGRRCTLDVDTGKWTGRQILEKIADKHRRFGSIIGVETNAAQMWMKEFALDFDASIPIRSHHTGKNKRDENFGVEQVFADIENGIWTMPSGERTVEKWIEGMQAYDPDKHTPDELMAAWIARDLARRCGAFTAVRQRRQGAVPSIASVLAR